jgi:uncharacterized membrane protein
MDPHTSGNLEEQVSELRSRVGMLEEALQTYGIVPEAREQRATPTLAADSATAIARQGPSTESVDEPPSMAEQPASPPSFGTAESALLRPSLESRIGSQWFNRIGILAVLIAMAWFLKLAIDNHWIGPLGRVLIGLISGVALIAWSEQFRRRGYVAFSYSLKAIGSGVLYLSLWAAFSYFHLIPSAAAFAAMIVVTAFNGFMAWVQDSEVLALYAIVGGFSTPVLISTGENHEVTLLSYMLLLDVAVLVLVVLRPWSRLLFSAYIGSALLFLAWGLEYYSHTQWVRTAFFLACFFIVFALAPRLVRVKKAEGEAPFGWDTLAQVVLPIANAALGFVGYYAMAENAGTDWVEPWLAVGFAGFYLLLLRLPARGKLKASPALLSALHLSVAVVFLTIAIPLKSHGRWLTIGWLTEGAALLWVAHRVRSRLLRGLALICLALGLMALLVVNPDAIATPVFNERFGTYCVGIAVFAFAAWLAARARPEADHSEADQNQTIQWTGLAGISVAVVNALILLAVGLEIHSYWWNLRWHGDANLYSDFSMYAQFTYSGWFMLFGAALLAAGFWRRSAFLRWQALLLVAVSIGKVFIVDVSELSQGYRILSFLGLGALLLAVSFVYQRDWLNLRGQDGQRL